MNIPVLIHSNPKEVRVSASVKLNPGVYQVLLSDGVDSEIELKLENGAAYAAKHNLKFQTQKTVTIQAHVIRPGTETVISLTLRKLS